MPELVANVDVAIIGGGFAGMATAWALRRLGITNTIVLERENELARYASGRSAGLGRQLAEDNDTTALTVRGAALMKDMPGVWTPSGGLLTFDDPANAEAYSVRAVRFGIAAEMVDRAFVAERWPVLADMRLSRALWVPGDGTIDVAGLLRTYGEGIHVMLGAGLERIEQSETGGPRLVTPKGTVTARVVVDAAGAWAGEITGGEPLTSFKRHIFILDADVHAAAPWLWHLGTTEMYMRPDGDGVLASPCDVAPSQPGHQAPDLVGEAHLRRVLDGADSSLATAPITRRWACQRSFTENRKMRLGRDSTRPWLVWAAGLGGHGATASPAVGETVAGEVVKSLS
ncbi:MAG TPA: FAD-dependent oxidoreductase [Kofleriaceae bacterium]|nr:FAD-dependent oxidoreductase [Kofleriaceae bacterium]